MMAAFIAVELFPGDRGGDWRAFAGAGRIRHDRRRAALIAEPVEEDPAFALDLADVRGEHLRLRLGDGAAEAVGETLHRRPILRGVERHYDVQALATCQQRK